MKLIIFITLLGLAIAGCQPESGKFEQEQTLSPDQVTEQIAHLRRQIIPPKGTSKADVDEVFGVPMEIKELKDKGSKAAYPMHIYQLLPPKAGQDFRVFLHVTYRSGDIHFVGINHMCVLKNRILFPKDSPEYIKLQKEIESENTRVLVDLIEIQLTYEDKLKDALWNE